MAQVPQVPPQPLEPQVLPVQFGWQTQTPLWHTLPLPHGQVPPQPSAPQVRPSQVGLQTQTPVRLHIWPEPHVPQDPPQPSEPQVLPVQLGTHAAHVRVAPLRTHRLEQHLSLSRQAAPPWRQVVSLVSSC